MMRTFYAIAVPMTPRVTKARKNLWNSTFFKIINNPTSSPRDWSEIFRLKTPRTAMLMTLAQISPTIPYDLKK
tara:strand:- start:203 stop:421 length:219 start_codon:yes stop_codon:yes gene_type:complete